MERSRFGAWLEGHAFHIDATLAALIVVFLVLPFNGLLTSGPPWVFSMGLGIIQCGALAWRRTRPVPSAVVVLGIALFHFLVQAPLAGPADISIYIALYSVTAYGPRWAGLTAICTTNTGVFALSVVFAVQNTSSGGIGASIFVLVLIFIGGSGSLLAVWAVALVQRAKVLRHRELVDRAERLEHERDQQNVIAAQHERTRIAREMHDVVAHSLSVIIAQADGAQYAAKAQPAVAIEALATIAATGRTALADTRQILGVLRTGADSDATPVTPQPSDHDIGQLVNQVRATGMRIAYTVIGQPQYLTPGIGLAAYRICQESLTNVLKHAGPAPEVQVRVTWRSNELGLVISDNGRGAASLPDSDGAGQGQVGMRERATAFGGEVRTGPRPGGGYQVSATIPLPPSFQVHPSMGNDGSVTTAR